MTKEDYKIIIYSIGYSIIRKRLLSGDLSIELIKKGYIDNESDITEYFKKKKEGYIIEVSNYDNDDFNIFIKDVFNYIKGNFDLEDYFHLSFTFLKDFIVLNNFDTMFKNKGFNHLLKELYNEIINNSKSEFTKSYSGGGLLTMIEDD